MASARFVCTAVVKEDHHKPIYCVTTNCLDPAHHDKLASVGGNRATVYQCHPDGSLKVLQCYVDEDKDEMLYVCRWGRDAASGAPLLFVAGFKGIIRLLDCVTNELRHTFAGHGDSVNDVCVLPHLPDLFLSASKDESIRLWNAVTRVCVLVIAGEGGHKTEVLSLHFHPWDQHRFLSASMDSTVKIWSLKNYEATIAASQAWRDQGVAFPTRTLQFPVFSSSQVHNDYVDCVHWLGDLCLSKSVQDGLLLWHPGAVHEPGAGSLPPVAAWAPRVAADAASRDALTDLGQPGPAAAAAPAPAGPGSGASGCVPGAGAAPQPGLASPPAGPQPSSRPSPAPPDAPAGLAGPGTPVTTAAAFTVLQELELPHSHMWWIKFALDPGGCLLACGNKFGRVFVWELDHEPPQLVAKLDLGVKCVVRQTAVSADGRCVLAATEDARVWRWDRIPAGPKP